MRPRRFFLAAFLLAGTAAFLLAVLKRRQAPAPALYARPEGGERDGEFELFIGS